MKIATLSPGNNTINVGANCLGTRGCCLNAVISKQGRYKALLHSLGMARVGAKLHAALLIVSHSLTPMRLRGVALSLEAQTHRLELVLNFLDGLNAEVADVEKIVLRELNKLTY